MHAPSYSKTIASSDITKVSMHLWARVYSLLNFMELCLEQGTLENV